MTMVPIELGREQLLAEPSISTAPSPTPTAREVLRRYWTNIGRPASLSLRVPILYTPIGAIGPLLLDQPANDKPFMAWVGVVVAGELALIAMFLIARPLVHRRSVQEHSRPLATLLALLIAAMVRGSVIAVLAALLVGAALPDELGYRLTAAMLFQAGFLVLIALNVHAHDDHRRLVGTLENERQKLAELDATAQQRLDSLHDALVDEVRTTIEPQVAQLLAAAAAVPGRDAQAVSARAFTDFVDQQVRPLSHRLASSARVDMQVDLPLTAQFRVHAPLPRRVAVGDCIVMAPSLWLIMVTGIVGAIRNTAPGGQFTFVAVMVLPMALGLFSIRRIAGHWVLPTPVAIGIVTAITASASTISALTLLLMGNAPARLPVAAMAVGLGIGASSAAYGAVSRARRDVEVRLLSAVARLQASLNVLRQKGWLLRRTLGYVTHGAIQGALHAAAMRLSGPGPCDADTITAISNDIRRALDKLESVTFEDPRIEDILDDIAALWDGQCSVHWSLESEVARLLAERAETSACIGEIAREAVANAIRHGRATQVEIVIRVEGMLMQVEVSDNGAVGPVGQPSGLGSQMLDEMCLNWSRDQGTDGSVLNATLGLGSYGPRPRVQIG